MKSRGGNSQRREERKKEDQRRERVRRKKMQGRQKVEKSRISVAKAAGAEPSGQLRDEQLHAVVARSTFHEVKMYKHRSVGPLLEVDMSKKRTPLLREAHFEVKMLKAPHARTTVEGSDVVLRGRRKGFCALPEVSKTWGFCSISKNDGSGTFDGDLQRCMSRCRRSTRGMFIRDARRSGRWFPERSCILEHQIFRFAKMILRDRCSALYDLASLFVAGAAL